MNRKRIILPILAGLAALLTACSGEKKEVFTTHEPVSNVAVISVQKASTPDYIETTGTVHASESAQISSQVLASVVGVNVREGDRVRKEQILVALDNAQFRSASDRASAAVTAAEKEAAAADANSNLAEATLKRYETLYNKKSVSPQEFDEVKARYQVALARLEMAHAGQAQARAALAEATTMQSYTRLVAPFDGVVTEKRVEIGNLASPGMPLLTVENTTHYRLEVSVNETDIGAVRIGTSVPVHIEALPSAPLPAKVAQVVPAADPASRSFLVKLDLPGLPDLRSGLFGRASIPKGVRDAVLVPRTAVLDRGQLQAVYVVGNDQVASLRYVTLGRAHDANVEILSGLESGERLVADPGQRDLSGKRLE